MSIQTLLCALLTATTTLAEGSPMPFTTVVPDTAGAFFRDHWVRRNAHASNQKGRLRVNDRQVSLDKNWGKRSEGTANGLMLAAFPEDLFQLRGAELHLELWGGHPGTAAKRFTLNGYGNYALPEVGTAAKHCTYSYPVVPVNVGDLVRGTNAIQFTCERAKTFWGHFIIDHACLRAWLNPDHPDIDSAGLCGFSASVAVDSAQAVADTHAVGLSVADSMVSKIERVEYYARYAGYDDRGVGADDGWHGYTHTRVPRHHVGTATTQPFSVRWDTRMIPSQTAPMALVALVRMADSLSYRTPVLGGLSFPKRRPQVVLHYCDTVPDHFWSRDKHEKKVAITLTGAEIEHAAKAVLITRIWDGGAGTVTEPFTVNGHPYDIISGRASHDVVFRTNPVPLDHLREGRNELRLYSDTKHHGIEMLLPGPALIIRSNQEQQTRSERATAGAHR